ncbi:ABC transporter permease [uncultured Enterovirga sp.]|uniref:ABC transporter permease n=1 Tax=uncultured Enterovirga sp. TaxID=2026352 RepID=UPI0035CAA8A0
MSDFGQAFRLALDLVVRLDPDFVAIVGLSLQVSLTASAIAFLVGTPIGAALAVYPLPGRAAVVVVANALLGLPPVVVGLLVYLLVSRAGPLGEFGILFTPTAMVMAQAVLALPIVIALTHRACEALWADYGDALVVDGASRPRAVLTLLAMGRTALVTVFLAAFGRSIGEVGAIILVGGNIRGVTRTMTTAIALETSRGDLALALALGLVLVALTLAVSVTAFALARLSQR